MLLPMGKDLSNANNIKYTFESVTKLTVAAFDFTKVEKITDEYCEAFYQEYIWLLNPGTIYANDLVFNVFKNTLPDRVGTDNFINRIEVVENV